jgi:hypothetical protein
VAFECHWFAAFQHQRIALCDDAVRMSLDRANAGVSLAGYWDTVHECPAGGSDYLAAMAGRVTESDYTFHVFPSRTIAVYTSDKQKFWLLPSRIASSIS